MSFSGGGGMSGDFVDYGLYRAREIELRAKMSVLENQIKEIPDARTRRALRREYAQVREECVFVVEMLHPEWD